jgi:hypothetical protein
MKQLIILLGTIFILGSCDKCHVCVVKDQDSITRYEYPEVCGSKKELSAYADQCETEYGKYNQTCACGEAP